VKTTILRGHVVFDKDEYPQPVGRLIPSP
jgi:hypothetical protein